MEGRVVISGCALCGGKRGRTSGVLERRDRDRDDGSRMWTAVCATCHKSRRPLHTSPGTRAYEERVSCPYR